MSYIVLSHDESDYSPTSGSKELECLHYSVLLGFAVLSDVSKETGFAVLALYSH